MNLFTIQRSFAISAGAGSGKTYTLSRRYINAYLGFDFFESGEGFDELKSAELDEIVTITFTEAAALEMKERIFSLMQKIIDFENLSKNDKEYSSIKKSLSNLDRSQIEYVKKRLLDALTKIDQSIITTIHGFCLDIVKRYADYIKIDTRLEVIDELEKEDIFEEAVYNTLNSKDYEDDVLFVSKYVSLFKSKSLIQKYLFSKKFRDSFDNLNHKEDVLKDLIVKFHLNLDDEVIDMADSEIFGIKNWIESLKSFNAVSFKEFIENSIGEKLNYRKNAHKQKYANVKVVRDSIDENRFEYDLEKETVFDEVLAKFQKILKAIKTQYDNALKQKSKIDFDKIIEYAHQILQKLKLTYEYVMIDEFQDTNSLQYEIAKLISKDANLFIVGDEKQSIYSFQGGEIEVFKKAIDEQFGNSEVMDINYRSDKEILKFVNIVFENVFAKKSLPIKDDFSASFQELQPNSKMCGKVEFLITKKDDEISLEEKEAENLAKYIKSIIEGKRHPKIKEYIDKKEKAIAIVFDAKSKIKTYKEVLNRYGIDCKVSGGDNFWDKEEIKDIFFVLKTIALDKKELNEFNRYYVVGALKSNILHFKEKDIEKIIETNEKIEINRFIPKDFLDESPHQIVRNLFVKSGAYLTYDNFEQVLANVEELINEIIELESEYGYKLEKIVNILESNIFEAEKEEAFYKSDMANSIELCSIHSTKGLAYPVVILAQSSKNLSKQSSTEGIKFEKFTDLDGKEHILIGFKIDEYKPLSYRVLSEISKLKHMEEKKRLLYVALTRAKHNIVISINDKPDNDSYAKMILDALRKDFDDIKEKIKIKDLEIDIVNEDDLKDVEPTNEYKEFEIIQPLKKLEFSKNYEDFKISSSNAEALIGVVVHEIIELYHNKLDDLYIEKIIDKYALWGQKDIIMQKIESFKKTNTYQELLKAKEKYFELNYDTGDKKGRIDLLYKTDDKWIVVDFKTGKERDYSSQLNEYKEALEKMGFENIEARLEYLDI